jgi:hypothetical protein
MKAISLWQPWASAIAAGLKQVETRGWSTSYRGPLAIHAAKHRTLDEEIFWGLNIENTGLMDSFKSIGVSSFDELPFGAIVCTCVLEHCAHSESFGSTWALSETEELFGNYSCGRFGWILRDVVPITPVQFKGRQGFFEWDAPAQKP